MHLTTTCLIVCSLISLFVMLKMAGSDVEIDSILFGLWVISPYLGLIGLIYLLDKAKLQHIREVSFLVSLLMLAFTSLVYVGTLGDKSSTAGLIFIFVPLWAHIGGYFCLGIGLLLAALFKKG